jgi:hypothetical protein
MKNSMIIIATLLFIACNKKEPNEFTLPTTICAESALYLQG